MEDKLLGDHGRRSATAIATTTTPVTPTASRGAGVAKAVRWIWRGCMTSFIVVVISLLKRFCKTQRHAREDLDRLHKMHVMYTFAELSILEFDPALGMECQRMAVREWKRREEHRKNREKLKDATQRLLQYGNGNEAQCKGNGLGPHIRITDRRRLHSEAGGDVSTDLHASEEGDDEGRESKHSRRAPGALDGQQDVDELDTVFLLFRRQDHSSNSNTIYNSTSTNISMSSDSRASRDNQVLFLVLRFRQRRGHRVASSLSGVERLTDAANPTPRKLPGGFDPFLFVSPSSEPIFHHHQSPTPGHNYGQRQ
ncbi:hypothetical protein M378DRAFT_904083 [Amanita muscaria Koide BX008]|uniref:Uncharacterized protein n=1 Tax=Amanita muscaria (strain Koide BX008) TaxID=946122 RepID=A0A0C2T370_AMAMK|nr:hypothetical protein M378DRAFT_577223 [Amanita muscaria Koide BX008]KIL60944.1 hypothetical protein M378DRAFT_904083 [Amanita muscaria Koide BX008]